jgi:hypothetical protein
MWDWDACKSDPTSNLRSAYRVSESKGAVGRLDHKRAAALARFGDEVLSQALCFARWAMMLGALLDGEALGASFVIGRGWLLSGASCRCSKAV